MTLGLRPERALLNDVNPHLINFYCWLRHGFAIDIPMQNDAHEFYRRRDRFNTLIAIGQADGQEAAALFYYLNRTGYNGLCRFNQSGGFNVPFGRYASIGYVRDFSEYQPTFSDWQFSQSDFEDLKLEARDFIYADPPYDVEFTSYSKDGFSWEDQERTARWLAKHKGPVILSNQATPQIVSLYKKLGFSLRFLAAPRMISCTGDRTPAKEVLALKNF